MTLPWMNSPFLDIDTIASRMYGTTSRWHSYRLRQKIQGTVAFESWEVELLNEIREELLSCLTPGPRSLVLPTEVQQ